MQHPTIQGIRANFQLLCKTEFLCRIETFVG